MFGSHGGFYCHCGCTATFYFATTERILRFIIWTAVNPFVILIRCRFDCVRNNPGVSNSDFFSLSNPVQVLFESFFECNDDLSSSPKRSDSPDPCGRPIHDAAKCFYTLLVPGKLYGMHSCKYFVSHHEPLSTTFVFTTTGRGETSRSTSTACHCANRFGKNVRSVVRPIDSSSMDDTASAKQQSFERE